MSFLVISLHKNSRISAKPRNSAVKGMPPIFTLMREFTVLIHKVVLTLNLPVQNWVANANQADNRILTQVGADVRWNLPPKVSHQKGNLGVTKCRYRVISFFKNLCLPPWSWIYWRSPESFESVPDTLWPVYRTCQQAQMMACLIVVNRIWSLGHNYLSWFKYLSQDQSGIQINNFL